MTKFVRVEDSSGYICLERLEDVKRFYIVKDVSVFDEHYDDLLKVVMKSENSAYFQIEYKVLKRDGTYCGSLDELPDCIVEL